jgi:hypothetical protein
MRFTICSVLLVALVTISPMEAQQPAGPPLMACGAHGDIEVFCGTHAPEDLELSPDGKYLIRPDGPRKQ